MLADGGRCVSRSVSQPTILALPEAAWRPAIDGDNQPRDGAWAAELTDHLALDAWPQGSSVIVRRERPHPAPRRGAPDDQQKYRSAERVAPSA